MDSALAVLETQCEAYKQYVTGSDDVLDTEN